MPFMAGGWGSTPTETLRCCRLGCRHPHLGWYDMMLAPLMMMMGNALNGVAHHHHHHSAIITGRRGLVVAKAKRRPSKEVLWVPRLNRSTY